MPNRLSNKDGFTLIELLVAMTLGLIVMASIGSVYLTQQKSYIAQEQIAGVQQNLRAAMYYMEREIRMAGCDPTQSGNPAIITADNDVFHFQSDLNGDGSISGSNEDVTFSLDAVGNEIERNIQPLASNIEALNFVYLDSASPPNILNVPDTITGDVPAADFHKIRSVQITVVARVANPDRGYTDNDAYFNQQDLVTPILAAQNDSFRRRRLTSNIKCRNL
jgi:type IV pilus assembly protein PilW